MPVFLHVNNQPFAILLLLQIVRFRTPDVQFCVVLSTPGIEKRHDAKPIIMQRCQEKNEEKIFPAIHVDAGENYLQNHLHLFSHQRSY
jgi:hypothetical protein